MFLKVSHRHQREDGERGVVMLETALTIAVFLFAIGAGFELLRFAYYGLVTQYVVLDSARFSSLGSNCPSCAANVRVNGIQNYIQQEAARYGVTLRDEDICIQSNFTADCGPNNRQDNSGAPGQLVAIRIQKTIGLLFGLGGIEVRAEAISKNEPFAVR